MNPYELLEKYGPANDRGKELLIAHSEVVAKYSLQVADWVSELSPDKTFIKEAALLHDIGIAQTFAPSIGCTGAEPYMKHGLLGARLLRELGYPRHARVCECHIGVGLTTQDIIAQNLPLPHADIVPETVEEQIIAYVDNFFSKGNAAIHTPRKFELVREKIAHFGDHCLITFDDWAERFGRVG